jgi:DNA primase
VAKIPEDVIEEIRRRANIVDVIGQHVRLRKAGKNHIGPCPFHDEKNPSFNVRADFGTYRCFGCGEAGTVFTFLMRKNGLTFVEAVEELGTRYGVAVPRDVAEDTGAKQARETMLQINRVACDFFVRTRRAAAADSFAVTYLREKRKLTPETIDRFALGVAPDSWQALADHLRAKKLPLDLALSLGLLSQKEGGRPYDKFRNRIMCPITDLRGQLIGFSGRTLGDDDAKYMNSADSPVFNKSRNFYALDLARDAIRKAGEAIVVEGNFDVIRLHQEGVGNAVAALGTALTRDHVRLLARMAERIVLVMDGDDAGEKAAFRAMELFVEADVEPSVVLLDRGDDPDSFVGKHGGDALRRKVAQAAPIVETFLDLETARGGTTVRGKTRAVRQVTEVLAKMDNPVRRALFAQRLADRTGVPLEAVDQALRHARGDGSAAPAAAAWTEESTSAPLSPEAAFCQLLYLYPKRAAAVADVALDDFADDRWREIARVGLRDLAGGRAQDVGAVVARFEEREARLIGDALTREPIAAPAEADRVLADCAAAIRQGAAKRKRLRLHAAMSEAERSGDRDRVRALQMEMRGLAPETKLKGVERR